MTDDAQDKERGKVKKSYTDKGAHGLRGDMIHRAPKTLRGKAVVPDKPDRKEQ